jgi:hypothetical protein
MADHNELGRKGEEVAVEYLVSKGHQNCSAQLAIPRL